MQYSHILLCAPLFIKEYHHWQAYCWFTDAEGKQQELFSLHLQKVLI